MSHCNLRRGLALAPARSRGYAGGARRCCLCNAAYDIREQLEHDLFALEQSETVWA